MAEIGIIKKFNASHGSKLHEHNFKVEVILEGKIDQQNGFVKGIDHHEIIEELENIISKLENKNLKDILTNEGYNSSGNESIAKYFIKKLKEKFPVKYVKIWETEERYAVIYSDEI